jgi:uncharacterized protein DUF4350
MQAKTFARTALVVTPLLAALVYVALNWFQLEEMPVWVKAGPAARKDPFLAFERYLVKMGGRAEIVDSPTGLSRLAPDATLFLAAHRLAYMTPRNVEAISSWVEHGGHLVVQGEAMGMRDPLLDAFGIERKGPPPPRLLGAAASMEPGRATVKFDWPGAATPLRAELATLVGYHDTRAREPLATIPFNSRVVGLAFASGRGRVTVLPSLGFLANTAIGHLDHAELGWLLASEGRAMPRVLLFLRYESPPLGEWIWAEAWPVVIAAALLLALWLGRVIPRFGPLVPDVATDRRSLAEHIVASGRFLWSRGQRRYLVAAVRERALRYARLRGLAERDVPAAGGTVENANDFIAAVGQLAAVESRLVRRANPRTREDKRT